MCLKKFFETHIDIDIYHCIIFTTKHFKMCPQIVWFIRTREFQISYHSSTGVFSRNPFNIFNPWVSQTTRRNPNDDNRFGEHMQWCPFCGFSGSTGWWKNPGTLTLLRTVKLLVGKTCSGHPVRMPWMRITKSTTTQPNRKNESDQRLISSPMNLVFVGGGV